MPELPEVEVVRVGLDRHAVGRTITRVEVLHPRPVRRDPRGPEGFAAALAGRRIVGTRRRGKYLWLPLDNGDALLGHLGMSGQFLVQPPDAPAERHLRIRLALDTPDVELRFVDQRMFGGLSVSAGGADLPPEIAHIARDPLDPLFDDEEFVARVRPGDRRTRAQVRELLDHSRDVMREALGEGGTSFDALYVNVNGESGYFDRSLHAYGREDEPCERCGTPLRRVAFMNRSSYFCPKCQPAPRRRRVTHSGAPVAD